MRLNREIKQKILDNAIAKSTLISEANALVSERAEIAENLRRQFVSEQDEKQILELAEDLKELGLKTGIHLCVYNHKTYEIEININGQRHDIPFSGFEHGISTNILKKFNRKIVEKVASTHKRYVVTEDSGLLENEKKCDALMERYTSLTTKVWAVLSKCNTDGQLLKLWPESAELIPKERVKPSTALMVKTDELNTILGLPSDNS